MEQYDLAINYGDVFLNGQLVNCNIGIKDEKIATLSKEVLRAEKIIDAKGKMVLPGTVDPHVHIRAPGNEYRETFLTGTEEAALGGVTTVLEMPISSPPPYLPEIVQNRMSIAAKEAVVDVAFFGAAGIDQKDSVIPCSQSGIVAFKTFLHEAPEGREKEFIGLTAPDTGDQYELMEILAKTGLITVFHAENNDMIKKNIARLRKEGKTSPIYHERSRPPVTEIETTAKVLLFAEKTGAKVEIAHISTPEAAELVKEAKEKGVPAIAETCPHYLFLNEQALIEHGAFAKCNPPVRSEAEREKMWEYLTRGYFDIVGSDHAPYTKEEKEKGNGDIFVPPAGFPGLSTRLPLMFTAVKEGKLKLAMMVQLICENPARIFGLYPQKGVILPGSDADLVIIDPDKKGKIDKDKMFTKCKDSALVYDGWEVYGQPEQTIVRGIVVYEHGQIKANPGFGKILKIEK
ncbi:MAG TPA: dihydroorotase family protein [Atribacterota bacterium]|nr:dihydroorotase family protein [Atribacterota bacterium]